MLAKALKVGMILAAAQAPLVYADVDVMPIDHAHPTKAAAARAAKVPAPSAGNEVYYHGGPVLLATKTLAIFWGAKWANANFAQDRIVGMDAFFSGFGGSSYAATPTEYYESDPVHQNLVDYVTTQSSYQGHAVDLAATPGPTKALTHAQAVNEACKMTGNNPDPATVYFIFTDSTQGKANYCGWHTQSACHNGKPVSVAYIPNLTGQADCSPGDRFTGHSEGLAAIASVSAHELVESISDPQGNAWFDNKGNETSDKCAWSFPPAPVVFANGSEWYIQMIWSNKSYMSSTGLPNLSGQLGCIYN